MKIAKELLVKGNAARNTSHNYSRISLLSQYSYFFTPDTHEHHLQPLMNLTDQILALKEMSKVLGVTLDTLFTFTQLCNNIAVKMQQRNNVLKALAGSTWGCDKETMQTTYQAIDQSMLIYCFPVWTPLRKDVNWSRHQLAQNSALRITNSSIKMADVAELHE